MKRNYNNSIIYIIKSDDLCYIGATTQKIEERLKTLRHYNFYSLREHDSLKRLLCCEDMKIEVLENYICKNKFELEKRVRYWRSIYNIDELNKPKSHKDEQYDVHPVVIESNVTIYWDR